MNQWKCGVKFLEADYIDFVVFGKMTLSVSLNILKGKTNISNQWLEETILLVTTVLN